MQILHITVQNLRSLHKSNLRAGMISLHGAFPIGAGLFARVLQFSQ